MKDSAWVFVNKYMTTISMQYNDVLILISSNGTGSSRCFDFSLLRYTRMNCYVYHFIETYSISWEKFLYRLYQVDADSYKLTLFSLAWECYNILQAIVLISSYYKNFTTFSIFLFVDPSKELEILSFEGLSEEIHSSFRLSSVFWSHPKGLRQ